MTVTLNEIIPFGQTFAENERMFALSAQDRQGKILGCGDGPASLG